MVHGSSEKSGVPTSDWNFVLLDLSGVFNTVDHKILLERLEHAVGVTGTVLQWFVSYL